MGKGLDPNGDSELLPLDQSTKWPFFTTSRGYLMIAIIVALVVAGGLIWYMRTQSEQNNLSTNTANTSISSKKAVDVPADDPLLAKFINTTTGEVWYDQRKPVAAQGWFRSEDINTYLNYPEASREKAEATLKEMMPSYYEVGKHGDKTIYLVVTPGEMGGPIPNLFEKKSDGTVNYIARPQTFSPELNAEQSQFISDQKTDKVSAVDTTTHYDSLSLPEYFVLENGEKVLRNEWGGIGYQNDQTLSNSDGVTKIRVADYGRNRLYRIETKFTDTQLTNIGYFLENVIGMVVPMDYIPNTQNLEKYTWTNNQPAKGPDYEGKVVFDDIKAIARGCGGTTAAVTRTETLKDSDLVAVGKTDNGRTVYQPKDADHALFKKAYDEYKQWQDINGQTIVSFEDYRTAHGIVIIKNSSNEVLVYVRNQYAPSYGCAKPVVYLYPATTTSVDVRVGAQVKISDPYYPREGWKNVIAEPSGTLTYQGLKYDSLFWEGPGYGTYPGITSGTVVKHADAVSTIQKQLKQQGLNQKEIADFMLFWSDKIPSKPYVRISWLTTTQMNYLAPLYISPKPDTVIRVFLDMDGYDTPISLPPQKLSSIPRRGFTVVEWGGVTPMMR